MIDEAQAKCCSFSHIDVTDIRSRQHDHSERLHAVCADISGSSQRHIGQCQVKSISPTKCRRCAVSANNAAVNFSSNIDDTATIANWDDVTGSEGILQPYCSSTYGGNRPSIRPPAQFSQN